LRPGYLADRLLDEGLHAEIKAADVIIGTDRVTGDIYGIFYGVALLRRIQRRGATEEAVVMMVPLDVEIDPAALEERE
jgi:hypothetical protein